MRWLVVLGCYGLMVGSAAAGEWSTETCRHLQEIKADIRADKEVSSPTRSAQLLPILLRQADHCTGSIPRATLAAELEGLEFKRPSSRSKSRQSINCGSVKVGDGMVATNCF